MTISFGPTFCHPDSEVSENFQSVSQHPCLDARVIQMQKRN